MDSGRLSRRIALVAGGTALVAMGTLTACSPTTEKEAPSTTSTTTSAPSSSSVAPSETEKAISPGGGNSFTPSVNPTPPGAVCTRIENGVCIR
jgi:hypothetical protein